MSQSIRIMIVSADGSVLDVIDDLDTDDLRNEIRHNPSGILASGDRSVDTYFETS